jgi:hypothetical protein
VQVSPASSLTMRHDDDVAISRATMLSNVDVDEDVDLFTVFSDGLVDFD